MRRPSGSTCSSRLVAVVSVPPPCEPPPSLRQRSFCVTGSHAISTPPGLASLGPIIGGTNGAAGVATGSVPGCASAPAAGGGSGAVPRPIPVLRPPSLKTNADGLTVKVDEFMNVDGMYTSPVCGLNDIGAQLCAPIGPG